MISFKVSYSDTLTIERIVDRAMDLNVSGLNRRTLMMDLTACHANGNPLDLEDLEKTDDFNFAHDVLGIARHIDRNTGKLLDCFSPRYSRRISA